MLFIWKKLEGVSRESKSISVSKKIETMFPGIIKRNTKPLLYNQ
jgi:hypothetical protein